MKKLIFGSTNPGKIQEVGELAAEYNIEVLSLADIGFKGDIEESGATFRENASIKVGAVRTFLEQQGDFEGAWIAGDDSGIAIDALDGEPGVFTRRWAGYHMSDDEIVGYCLGGVHGIHPENRSAEFVCMVALGRVGSQDVRYFKGEIAGKIAENKDPNINPIEGYPFRSLFILDETGLLMGQSSLGTERVLTHRQKSFKSLFEVL